MLEHLKSRLKLSYTNYYLIGRFSANYSGRRRQSRVRDYNTGTGGGAKKVSTLMFPFVFRNAV